MMRAFFAAITFIVCGSLAGPASAASSKRPAGLRSGPATTSGSQAAPASSTQALFPSGPSRRPTANGALPGRTRARTTKRSPTTAMAIRTDPTLSAPWHNRAQLFLYRNEYDKAIADYNEAIKLDPSYAPSFRGRADCWDYKKEHDKAIADYSEAIRLDPKDPYAFSGRADAYNSKARIRPRHRRLQRSDPPRSQICHRLQQPRQCLREQGRLRPRHCRLQRGDQARSEIRRSPSRNRGDAWSKQGRLRSRHRRLRRRHPARSEECRRLQEPRRRLEQQEGIRPRHRRP